MQKSKNNSRVKVPSNFRIEIDEYRRRSLQKGNSLRGSNRKIHVHSSLLHAQRNIKLITKNQIKRQLLEAEFPMESLPKLRKDRNRNSSAMEKDRSWMTDTNTELNESLRDNNKEIKALKNLLMTVKDNKKANKDKTMNFLGLQIKKIEPLHYDPRNTEAVINNTINHTHHNHSSSLYQIQQKDFHSKLFINDQNRQQQQQQFFSSPTKSITKKKTFSMATKYQHYKAPKFNFSVGSEGYKIYQKRFKIYRQFIFIIQLAHNVYIEQKQSSDNSLYLKNQEKFKIWIGPGNNWLLIKSLIKRRYWWMITQDRSEANFVWSQIKVNTLFDRQKGSEVQQQALELRKSYDDQESVDNKKKRPQTIIKRADKKQIDNLNTQLLHKILTPDDKQLVKKYIEKHLAKQKKSSKLIQYRHKNIKKPVVQVQQTKFLVHNHLENNFFLGNKKAMFYNLKQYYELIHDNVFNYLPLTFHIRNGTNDIQYKRFLMYYNKRAAYIAKQQKQEQQRLKKQDQQQEDDEPRKKVKKLRNIWIVKPGELSNRGNGITVIDQLYEINSMLNKKQKHQNGTNKTYIVQLYIDRPMLYNNRKFDIRHYMLVTNMFGVMRGYWYQQGYIRTASYQFDIFTFQKEIHLTNDAVQKHTPNYGKYQPGNKLSYAQFQRYLDSKYPKKGYNFQAQIIPKMKKVATDAVRSAYLKLSPTHKQNNFQIFGLDFMIDADFKPWLIQINTNPCLQLSSHLLQRIIPTMVQNSFRLSLDILFPPPTHYPNTSKHLVPDLSLQNLKYQLIFDSLTQGSQVRRLYRDIKIQKLMDQIGAISDQQDQYQDQGQQIRFDDQL